MRGSKKGKEKEKEKERGERKGETYKGLGEFSGNWNMFNHAIVIAYRTIF